MSKKIIITIVAIFLLVSIAWGGIYLANREGENDQEIDRDGSDISQDVGAGESLANLEDDDGIQLISAFVDGGAIPIVYTCDGENLSPALAWSDLPKGVKSIALTFFDPDASGGGFVHWVMYNIPASLTGLAQGIDPVDEIPGAGMQGVNGAEESGYTGPCPPQGSSHQYVFTLYALDQQLDLLPGATLDELQAAMKDHLLAQGVLTGIYSR